MELRTDTTNLQWQKSEQWFCGWVLPEKVYERTLWDNIPIIRNINVGLAKKLFWVFP